MPVLRLRGVHILAEETYSTAQVSKFCGVHISTVIRWVNSGELPVTSNVKGSRRILQSDLLRFMRLRSYPLPPELELEKRQRREVVLDEGFFKEAVDSAGVAIFGLDSDLRFNFFNRRAEEITGYSRHEARQQGFIDRLIPDEEERAKVADIRERLLKGEQVDEIEVAIATKRRSQRWLAVSLSPVIDARSGVESFVCSAYDLTEHILRERELRWSSGFLDSVLDNSPVSLQIVDRDGSTVKINRSLSRTFHVEAEDIVGPGKHNFFDDAILRRTGLSEAVRRAFEGDIIEVPFAELKADTDDPREDGQTVVSAVAFPIGHGDDIRYVGVVYEDITEKAVLQRDLIAKNAELESFVYTVAHDLKSPLSVVGGAGEALVDSLQGNEPALKQIRMILRSTGRMLEFISGLLALSRAGRFDDENEYDTPCRLIVNEIMLDLRAANQGQEIRLEVGDLPDINLHHDAATQLFQNLIFNAFNYRHPERVPSINVDCQTSAQFHRFSVSDNGIGIEASQRRKIFDVFYRAPGTSTSGTGIGLAIVRRIVERAGGKVWVESKPGVGSTFYFTIPR